MMINSYVVPDDIMRDTLTKSKSVFQSCPSDEIELPFNYTSVIFNSIPLTKEQMIKKIKVNPI